MKDKSKKGKKPFVPFTKDGEKPADDKDAKDKDAKAAADAAADAKSAVASIIEEPGQVSPTNGVAATPTLREQMLKAFSEGVTIRK